MLASINLFVRDLESMVAFYSGLFEMTERVEQRSSIFRALAAGSVDIGFNGREAYRLLNLEATEPAGTAFMLTFEVSHHAEVERLTQKAADRGAEIVKAPYDTAYGSRQSVLRDPEGNVFRINAFSSSDNRTT